MDYNTDILVCVVSVVAILVWCVVLLNKIDQRDEEIVKLKGVIDTFGADKLDAKPKDKKPDPRQPGEGTYPAPVTYPAPMAQETTPKPLPEEEKSKAVLQAMATARGDEKIINEVAAALHGNDIVKTKDRNDILGCHKYHIVLGEHEFHTDSWEEYYPPHYMFMLKCGSRLTGDLKPSGITFIDADGDKIIIPSMHGLIICEDT